MEQKTFFIGVSLHGPFLYGLSTIADSLLHEFPDTVLNLQKVRPVHITCKSPFQADDDQIESLKDVMNQFQSTFEPIEVKFGDVEMLKSDDHVVCAVCVSDKTQVLLDEFQKKLHDALSSQLPWMKFSDYDKKKRHHVSFLKGADMNPVCEKFKREGIALPDTSLFFHSLELFEKMKSGVYTYQHF